MNLLKKKSPKRTELMGKKQKMIIYQNIKNGKFLKQMILWYQKKIDRENFSAVQKQKYRKKKKIF